MRRLGVALLALSGCNQVFGIKDTAKQPDAADPRFVGHMNWVAPQGSGTVVFPIGGEAIDTQPLMLQIGAGAGSGSDSLAAAPYDAMTGEFSLGFMLAGQAWRLVYTLPEEAITHEWQWNIQAPDLVIPRMTRKDATPIPQQSGYDIQPTPATSFSIPAIATGGAFTYNTVPDTEFAGNHITYTHSDNAQAISGPVSAPDPAADWILVTDQASCSGTVSCVTGWAVAQPSAANPATLTANTLTPLTPAWHAGGLLTIKPNAVATTAKMRLSTALNALGQDDAGNGLPSYGHMIYGLSPSTVVYGFRGAPASCGTLSADVSLSGVDCLGSPAQIPLADDGVLETAIQVPDISALTLTPTLYARVTIVRQVHGIALASAIQSMVTTPRPPTANETIDILTSTVADAVLVDQVRLDASDLSGATGPASMDVPVAAGAQPRLLTFHPRLGQDGALQARADDYVITLWQIQSPDSAAAKLHAVRIYHVIDASHGVYVEGSLLQPGLYVFSITARIGFPNAAMGDYKVVTFPLGESTVFSRQFHVQ